MNTDSYRRDSAGLKGSTLEERLTGPLIWTQITAIMMVPVKATTELLARVKAEALATLSLAPISTAKRAMLKYLASRLVILSFHRGC